ncbi:hypothetical protein [Aquabacterium sp.]|uniref:hypothetical protein n=1 Tax=Aquabacterium sp. TaxID=1872578 RepID=UPI003BAF5BB1
MSGIFERLFSVIFEVFNFFDNLRTRRGDDELTAEYKRLQRGFLASIVYILVLGVVVTAAVNIVDALEGLATIHPTLTSTRETLGYLFGLAFLLALLYVGYKWISLLLFMRKHGAP